MCATQDGDKELSSEDVIQNDGQTYANAAPHTSGSSSRWSKPIRGTRFGPHNRRPQRAPLVPPIGLGAGPRPAGRKPKPGPVKNNG
ncbi:hypothetical protein MTO96_034428 [Rhipicephalus appendiculatus]